MKNYALFLTAAFLFGILSSCNRSSQSDRKHTTANDTATLSVDSASETATTRFELPYTAEYNEETDRFEIRENTSPSASHTSEGIAQALNSRYPDITLQVSNVQSDTLYASIADARYLTQSIGTTGAMSYLAEATYSFTSLPAIHVVNFSFKEGDHAIPGPYTRADFQDFLK